MKASELKNNLSENDIYSLLQDLGAEPYKEGNSIRAITICHNHDGSGSHKLYYNDERKSFHCFTGCQASFDVFQLLEKSKDCSFSDAFKYIKEYFGYFSNDYEDISYEDRLDMSFFDKFKPKKREVKLPKVDPKVLSLYENQYHISWVREHISVPTMRKFDIKLDVLDQRIVIPHKDKFGNIIGIRVRNLKKELVERGMKYIPLKKGKKMFNHPTGANLYGLYENLDNIKRMKKVILFESEKSVMQLDSFYDGKGIGVCVSGSSFSDYQLDLLKNIDIEEVCIAFDKEYNEVGDPLERFYAKKIQETIANKLSLYHNVTVVWDMKGLLEEKMSPTDKGFDTWKELWDNRLYINDTGGI